MLTSQRLSANSTALEQAAQISALHLNGESIALQLPGQQFLDPSSENFAESHPIRHALFETGLRALAGDSFQGFNSANIETLRQLNALQSYLVDHQLDTANRTLREGQDQAFASLSRFFEMGGRTGYMVLPTRSGKTVIFLEFLEALQTKALVVTPSKFLCKQTKERQAEFAPEMDLGLHYGDIKEGLDHDVVVTTKDSFVAMVKRGEIKPGQFPVMILDEAHEFLTELKETTLEPFIEKDIVIGFTATDEYDAEKNVRRLLSNEIHRLTIPEAVALELNCPFKVMTVETQIDLSDVRTAYHRGDYNKRDIDLAINQESLNRSAVQLYQAHFDGQVGICNVGSVRHARALSKAFNEAGIPARAVWGKMDKRHFRSAVRGHARGKIKVITNVDLFTRGYDNKLMTFAFNITPTLSLVVAGQRGGRPLTVDPANPDKLATIVEFLHRDSERRRRQQTFVDFTHAAYIPAPRHTGRTADVGKKERSKKIEVEGLQVTAEPETVLQVIKKRAAGAETIKRKVAYNSDSISLKIKKAQRAAERALMKLPITTLYLGSKLENPEQTKIKVDETAAGLFAKVKERALGELSRLQEGSVPLKQLEVISDMNAEMLVHFERKFRELSLRASHFAEVRVQVERAAQELEAIVCAMQAEVAPDLDGHILLSVFDSRAGIYQQEKPYREALCSADPDIERRFQLYLEEEIKQWEKRWYTRWDLFTDIYREVRKNEMEALVQRDALASSASDSIREGALRFEGGALEHKELLAEARVAIEEAADDFCSEHTPHRFATVAARAIDDRLKEITRQNNLATGEIHGTEEIRATVAAIEALRAENGVEPDSKTLARTLRIKVREASERLLLLDRLHEPVALYSQMETSMSPFLFDADNEAVLPFGDDEIVLPFEETLPADPEAMNPVDLFFGGGEEQQIMMNIVLGKEHRGTLEHRERTILLMRYGITEQYPEPLTLEEVGARLKITKERVRQIEAKAIRKLQEAAPLRPFLN